jgi:hypothetical protein
VRATSRSRSLAGEARSVWECIAAARVRADGEERGSERAKRLTGSVGRDEDGEEEGEEGEEEDEYAAEGDAGV